MRYSCLSAALLLAASSLAARPAAAQLNTQPGVFLGVAIPTGDFNQVAKTGATVGLGLRVKPILLPVALRVDGAYTQFAYEAVATSVTPGGTTTTDQSANLWSATVDGELDIPLSGIYLLAGLGVYSTPRGIGSGSGAHAGENVGVGLRLPVPILRVFLEARYHRINSGGNGMSYIPIVAGVNF